MKSLAFEVPEQFKKAKVQVVAAGKTLAHEHKLNEGRIEITLNGRVVLQAEQMLAVTIQR